MTRYFFFVRFYNEPSLNYDSSASCITSVYFKPYNFFKDSNNKEYGCQGVAPWIRRVGRKQKRFKVRKSEDSTSGKVIATSSQRTIEYPLFHFKKDTILAHKNNQNV